MSDNVFVAETKQKQEPVNFATVTGVFEDGLTLRLDGEETATQKRYKCNKFCVFAVGDRVRIIKDSGTYVVEYPIGNPMKKVEAKTSENVSSTINNVAISSIFESDGKTATQAKNTTGIQDYQSNAYRMRLRYSNGYIQIFHTYKNTWVNLIAY